MRKLILVFLLFALFIISCGNYRSREFLDQKGYEFTEKEFLRSVQSSDSAAVYHFLKAGMDANAITEDGRSALLIASSKNNYGIARMLLEENAKPDYTQKSGMTALMFAANRGNSRMIELLLKHDADPNKKELSDRTALHFASLHGYLDSVRLLLENGADPNAKDKHGMTPIIRAAMKDYIDIAEELLKHGADPTIRDKFRRDAFFFAKKNPDSELALVMEKYEDSKKQKIDKNEKTVF